jgi:hypothetical protein
MKILATVVCSVALISTAPTAHGDPLTTPQIQDAVNMAGDWCMYIESSETPMQGAMLAMDLAQMDFSYSPNAIAGMVAHGVRVLCPQYQTATVSAGQTWLRKQSSAALPDYPINDY